MEVHTVTSQGADDVPDRDQAGRRIVFRTIEELATGIRNGLITPRARIYHNASQKWLPIEFHPHYKKALQMPGRLWARRPAVGVASTSRRISSQAPSRPVDAPVTQDSPSHLRRRTREPPSPIRCLVPCTCGQSGSEIVDTSRRRGFVFVRGQRRPVDLGIAAVRPVSSTRRCPRRSESFSPVVELPTIDLPQTTAGESRSRSPRRRARAATAAPAISVLDRRRS